MWQTREKGTSGILAENFTSSIAHVRLEKKVDEGISLCYTIKQAREMEGDDPNQCGGHVVLCA